MLCDGWQLEGTRQNNEKMDEYESAAPASHADYEWYFARSFANCNDVSPLEKDEFVKCLAVGNGHH